jgi:GTP-sensing pleiotropic transcriptional regulator CodY
MSTTRKIEGLSIQLGNRKFRFTEESGAPMATEERATLVIGGKCLTEEEHEAEFQRRAKAMVKDILAILSPDRVEIVEQTICPDHGIQLP